MPPFVSLRGLTAGLEPGYLGVAHRAFTPDGPGVQNLKLPAGVSAARMEDRKELLTAFDAARFAPQGGTLGTNRKNPPAPGFADVEMWFWMDTWPYIVDMLRNEKPVYFVFNDANQVGSLHTGWEPTVKKSESRLSTFFARGLRHDIAAA